MLPTMSKPTHHASLVHAIAAALAGGGILAACSSSPKAAEGPDGSVAPKATAPAGTAAANKAGQPAVAPQQEVAAKPKITLPPGMKIPDDHEISAPEAEEAPTQIRGQQKRPAPQPAKVPAPAAKPEQEAKPAVEVKPAPDAAPAAAPAAPAAAPAAPAAAQLPPLLVLPDAQAIVDRAVKQAKDIKTIDVVTCTNMVGVPENRQPAGVGKSRRVQLRFTQNDSASIPMMRVAEVVDGKVGEAFIYDGRRAVLVNDEAKTFFDAGTDWFRIGSRAFPALPTWFVATRAKSFIGPRDNANAGLEPVIVGARILRQETFDGVACDVVELLKSRDLYNPDIGNGEGAVTDVVYTIETIHYGKTDGWPRKVVIQSVAERTPTGEVVTSTYSGLKVNGDFDQTTFAAKGPEGYTPRERP